MLTSGSCSDAKRLGRFTVSRVTNEEVTLVLQHRLVQGLSVGAIAIGLALGPAFSAPAAVRQAAALRGSGHLCRDLKAEQNSSASVGTSIAAALEKGQFVKAQQQILKSIDLGLKQAAPALADLRSAPKNVQSALRALVKFDNTLKTVIKKSTSITNMDAAIQSLATPKLTAEASIVSNYLRAKCGAIASTGTPTTIG
jgi:hypothetical protein